jgi:polyhydroxybutyrate depolymerase
VPRPVAATAAPSRSCQRPAAPGTSTLTVGGRVARLHIPQGYRADRALPLVLNLHGTGATAAQQETASQLDRTADAHRFLVAYPQGSRRTSGGFAWNIPGTPAWQAAGPDEATYLRQLVALVSERYCVDARRIYGTGFSGGAREVSQLACEADPLFAAVAAVGGLRAPSPCAAGAVPVLGIHGSADAQNPYDGHGPAYWTYSVPEAARRWAGHDHCPGAPVLTTQPGATLTAYRPCQGGTVVELYTLPGKGHGWPGGFPTDELIWQFFADHPRPRGNGKTTPR